MKYFIDKCLVVEEEVLDRGFVLDDVEGIVEWTEPIPGGKTHTFDIDECTYPDGNFVSVEDGELIGTSQS